MGTDHLHRVATYRQVEAALMAQTRFFVNECFCRGPAREGTAPYEYCGHPTWTCLGLVEPGPDFGYPYREIDQIEALQLIEDWKNIGRLFRFMEDELWICCCCSCGCGWFRDQEGNRIKDPCLKSPEIEATDPALCLHCGDCIPTCPYEARALVNAKMTINSADCYGCSACEPACPQQAIAMVVRSEHA